MKLVIRVKLLPTPQQASALQATLHACNEAANHASRCAFTTGIRERARLKKPQRVTLNSWAFGQLGSFIAYKARKAGVPVVHVNPAYTSQECSQCHHIDKRNRPRQAVFTCRSCGFVEHADLNASHTIAQRGWWMWVCGAESQVPVLRLVA